MSRYKVETGSLYTLARAMDIGANAVDQAMRQSVATGSYSREARRCGPTRSGWPVRCGIWTR